MRESAALKQPDAGAKSTADDVIRIFAESIANGDRTDQPYPHWVLRNCLPDDAIEDIMALPFPAPSLDGVSGKRELHNNTRKYFDVENWELPGGIQNKLHLHARRIRIAHPDGGTLDVTAPLPPHMVQTWNLLGFDPDSELDSA